YGIRPWQALEEAAVEIIVGQVRIEAAVEATFYEHVGINGVDGVFNLDVVVIHRGLKAGERTVGGLENQAQRVGVGRFLGKVRVAAGKALELGIAEDERVHRGFRYALSDAQCPCSRVILRSQDIAVRIVEVIGARVAETDGGEVYGRRRIKLVDIRRTNRSLVA